MNTFYNEMDSGTLVCNVTQSTLEALNGLTPDTITKPETKTRLENLSKQIEYMNQSANTNEFYIEKDARNLNIRLHSGESINSLIVVDSKGTNPKLAAPVAKGMEQEALRLGTFKTWPHVAPVSAGALARAGFFYKGVDDRVECFACQGQIKDWEHGDTAMGEHKKHFPRCHFVRDTNYKNIPLLAPTFQSGATSSSYAEKRAKEKAAVLFKVGPSETSKSQSGKNAMKKIPGVGFDENIKTQEGKPTRQPTIDSVELETRLTFKSEFKRLLSFQTWPRTNPVEPKDLAKAGFYYLEKDDAVQCFACFGKINKWEPCDVPAKEHEKHFPSCPFILGLDVKNEPITPLQLANAMSMTYRESPGFDTTLQLFSKQVEAALPQTAKVRSRWIEGPSQELAINQPKFPLYTGENRRLSTYAEGWPGVLGIEPRTLARAGFFYTGEGDNTKCFYCGGGLKNWETTDEPWTEHAKWFPSCAWLLQQRGNTFVTYVVRNFPVGSQQLLMEHRGRDEAIPKHKPTASAPPIAQASRSPSAAAAAAAAQGLEQEAAVLIKTTSAKKHIPLEQAMSNPHTGRVLEMGYDPNLVRKVIKHRLHTRGSEFKTTNDILEAVWQAEESVRLSSSSEEDQAGTTETVEKFMQEMPEKKRKNNRREDNELSDLSRQLGDIQIKGGSTGPSASSRVRTERVLERQMSPTQFEQEIERLRDEKLCKVCMDEDANTVLMPCTHLVVCHTCSGSLNVCPICRLPIREVVRIFKS